MRKRLSIWSWDVAGVICGACTIILVCLPRLSTAQTDFWHQCTGPYGGGEINALAFDSSGDVYAAVASFGIYVSTDNGATWIQDDSGLTDLNVQSIAALRGGVMLASTFSGIFRSQGIGHGWTLVNNQFKFNIDDSSGVAVNAMMQGPLDSVYAATSDGLMESMDSGTTWSTLFSGQYSVNSLAMSAGGRIYAGSNNFVFTSRDSGATWTSFPVGFAEIPVHYTISIAPLPDGNVAVSSTRDGIILFSSDGDTAKGYLMGVNAPGPGLLAACRLPDSDTSADLYDGTYDGLYKLASGATNWTHVPLDTVDYIITALLCHDGTIFAGTASHGLYRSTDYGATWTHPTDGMASLQIETLTIAKPPNATNQAGYIFAGAMGNGIYRSTDNGNDWGRVSNGIVQATPYSDYFLSSGPTGKLYALVGNALFSSMDGGMQWDSLGGTPGSPAYASAINTNLPGDTVGLLVASGQNQNGVFTSKDGGVTWVFGHAGFEGWVNAADFLPSTSAGASGGYLFISARSEIFRSSDDGVTWSLDVDSLQNYYNVQCFCVPNNALSGPNSNDIYAGGGGGVFLSANGGLVWNSVGLSDQVVNCLAATRDGSIFAGTQSAGVYRLAPGDTTWKQVNSGLSGVDVSSLAVDSLGYLYAATEKGIFRTTGVVDAIHRTNTATPSGFYLAQNFPNPFNPSTNIRYELSANSYVTLKVYDILGREVVTLVDGREPAALHTVTWNASRFASGVYFYRLVSSYGNHRHVETKAMVLIK